MNAFGDSGNDFPALKNDGRMYVYLSGNYFTQNKVIIPNNNNVINMYCVYELQPMVPSRYTTFTVQNALFSAMEITKNVDTSKYKYKGYGVCFDEGGTFNKGNINNGRNVLILVFTSLRWSMLIIKPLILLLWVMLLCKGLTTRHCMQKKCTVKILVNQVKSLC